MTLEQNQADRIERKLDRVIEYQAKLGRIITAHGVKIKTLETASAGFNSKGWSLIMLVISATVGALFTRLIPGDKP